MFVLIFLALCFSSIALDTLWTPVDIPMRDGKTLAADFYALDSTVVKPVILIQTPYNKVSYRHASSLIDTSDTSGIWNIRHYHFVILDWRGFNASLPADSLGYDRGLDGYDAVEWIAERPWCNGNVGTYGGSALGDIQFKTAKHQPPHLVCCAPFIKDFKTKYSDYYYGGVFRKQHTEALEGLGFITTDIILAHPTYGFVWEYIENVSDYPESLEVPMLLVSGWFDHYPNDCLRAFKDLRERSDPSVRSLHRMVMGPWAHGGMDKLSQGELEFPEAVDVSDDMVKIFFDHFLRGADNGFDATPALTFFQMGENIWFSADDWFDLADEADTLYLTFGGGLSSTVPSISSTFDTIIYNPRDPSPSYGAACFDPRDPSVVIGPVDISDTVESRDDILIFSTDILSENLRICGSVAIELYISSNRLDTDFAARLCDVYPDGRSIILTDGIRRARFRNGFSDSDEELLTPDLVYLVPVELQEIAHTFLAGHRLRIDITSSDYPRFDMNLNNGGAMYIDGDTLIATNKIFMDSLRPSRVIISKSSTVDITDESSDDFIERPSFYSILAYPNPFNSAVRISVDCRGWINQTPTVEIFDIAGRIVAEISVGEEHLLTEGKSHGRVLPNDGRAHRPSPTTIIWSPDASVGSGVYLISIKTGGNIYTKPVIYIK